LSLLWSAATEKSIVKLWHTIAYMKMVVGPIKILSTKV